MRKYFWVIFLSLILTASCVMYIPRDYGEPGAEPEYYERDYYDDLDISFFYDHLSPYGNWIYYSPHGYVWAPYNPGYRWRPYTRGRWIWTDHGWTWFSDFKWGWAPFHYGRWGWDPDLGWFWVPGTVWGPAWVTWRWSNIYIGWAPLPPDIAFMMRLNALPYSLPHYYWVFVEGHYFWNPYLYRYTLPYERNVTIINYSVIRTNIYVENLRVINRGIDTDVVRRVTKRELTKRQLKDLNKPEISRVEAREAEIFRPTIKKDKAAKPKKVLSKEEAKVKISRGTIRKSVD